MQVLVFPTSRVRGVKSAGGNLGHVGHLGGLEEALRHPFDSDAHFTQYLPSEGTQRLTTATLSKVPGGDGAPVAYMHYLVGDYDLSPKRPWQEGEFDAWLESVRLDPVGVCAWIYPTTHGARLIWKLATPFEVRTREDGEVWRESYKHFCREVFTAYDLDLQCCDWTRLFRLPNSSVLREREGEDYICPVYRPQADTPVVFSPSTLYVRNAQIARTQATSGHPNADTASDDLVFSKSTYTVGELIAEHSTISLQLLAQDPLFQWAATYPSNVTYTLWRGLASNVYGVAPDAEGLQFFLDLSANDAERYEEATAHEMWDNVAKSFQEGHGPYSYARLTDEVLGDVTSPKGVSPAGRVRHRLRQVPIAAPLPTPAAEESGPWGDVGYVQEILMRHAVGSGPSARLVITKNHVNLVTIFGRDAYFKDAFALNVLEGYVPEYRGRVVDKKVLSEIKVYLDTHYIPFSWVDIEYALANVCGRKVYHPVQDYLLDLQWDGEDRVPLVLQAIGADDTPYHRTLIRKWLVSAVVRPLQIQTWRQPQEPTNIKVDTVLVLTGSQGAFKGTFIRALVPEPRWALENLPDVETNPKDASQQMISKWLVEWGEFEHIYRRSSVSHIKAFITRIFESFRPPYGKAPVTKPRTAILIGTTNEDIFLNDPTGDRRFWALRAEGKDYGAVEGLAAWRDQVWGQAVALYRAGETWWLSDLEDEQRAEKNAEFRRENPEDVLIAEWVRKTCPTYTVGGVVYEGGFSTLDVQLKVFLREPGQVQAYMLQSTGAALRRLGFSPKKVKRDGVSRRVYLRPVTAVVGEASLNGTS